jgi:prepilin-type N-terminal cleavage/methylation domain-containing protein
LVARTGSRADQRAIGRLAAGENRTSSAMSWGTRPGHSVRRRRGFSLVEMLVAVTVLIIVAGGALLALLTSLSLGRSTRETSLALDAARGVIEAMRSEEPDEVFALYNANPGDDPGGAPGPGNAFGVPGLDAVPGDPDGLPGQIEFPGDGISLREDGFDDALGMPRDLDGDGVTDAADHALDYSILPVRVRVRWTGSAGVREIVIVSTLMGG